MTLEIVRDTFAWCIVLNIGFLLFWFLLFTFAHDWMYQTHKKWFNISIEKFDAIHYSGMGILKVEMILFSLVPYLALRIVG